MARGRLRGFLSAGRKKVDRFEVEESGSQVHIFESEVRVIAEEACRNPNRETGGCLFGSFTHGNAPVVWLASGPAPGAVLRQTHFEQDPAFMTHWQNKLFYQYGLQYVGGWHSHHQLGLRAPSEGDLVSAQQYAVRHGRHKNVEMIVTLEGGAGEPSLWPYVFFDAQSGRCLTSSLRVIPGDSPLRTEVQRQVGFSNLNRLDKDRVAEGRVVVEDVHAEQDSVVCSRGIDVSGAPAATSEVISSRLAGEVVPADIQKAIEMLREIGVGAEDVQVERRRDLWMVLIPFGSREARKVAVVLESRDGRFWVCQVFIIKNAQGGYEEIEALLQKV